MNLNLDLNKLGWHAFFEKHLESINKEDFNIGRICTEQKESYRIFSQNGELSAVISGKFRNSCKSREDFPAVGDWVLFKKLEDENKGIIHSCLPRKSKFSRKVAGKETQEQIIASNVDFAFIVCALNYDFNLRRIERYLSLVWQSGATPVILLTKSDLCDDIEEKIIKVKDIAPYIDICAISNISTEGIEKLQKYFDDNKTVVLLGSSGAGKSSLINNLANEKIMKVSELRNNLEKGRHTTTHRQMIILPNGGLIIDTPGIRELQLWDAEEGISQTFNDIEEIAKTFKFSNCKHINEPDCAIQEAINAGSLDPKRFENYLKVQKEQEYLHSRQTQSLSQIERNKWKAIHKQIRKLDK